MREMTGGRVGGWWWRIDRRTNGIAVSFNWPSRTWDQWQVSLIIIVLSFGKVRT